MIKLRPYSWNKPNISKQTRSINMRSSPPWHCLGTTRFPVRGKSSDGPKYADVRKREWTFFSSCKNCDVGVVDLEESKQMTGQRALPPTGEHWYCRPCRTNSSGIWFGCRRSSRSKAGKNRDPWTACFVRLACISDNTASLVLGKIVTWYQ